MFQAAVSHELRPMLAGHWLHTPVEDVLFQGARAAQLGKDLLRISCLVRKSPALSYLANRFLLSDDRFEQGNGINRVWRLIVPVCHGMFSLSPAM